MSNESATPAPQVSQDFISRPVHLLPRFVERIWGAHSLAPYFPDSEKLIGEVWLTDEQCEIEGSVLTLGQLAAWFPEDFCSANEIAFPLLIKLLFPREKLSVQVHPDDAYAQARLGQPHGKTECWYVVSAEPGAEVAVGLRTPMSAADVQRAIAEGTLEAHLRMIPVQAGDMVFVDAGTVHAIGGGVILLETQQYSDVTYRLWDYGRPRELHVEEGLSVLKASTRAGLVRPSSMGAFDRLLSCPYFIVDRFRLEPGRQIELDDTAHLQIFIALSANATLRDALGSDYPLPRAHAVLLPAHAPAHFLHAYSTVDIIRVMPGRN